MIAVTTDQRTEAWRAARIGCLTGSRAGDMLARIQKGESAKRRDYRLQLACERLIGQSCDDTYVSKDMQRGIDREADAVALYEAVTGRLVTPCGFLLHDELQAGCSPDGQIGHFTGIVEVKCPRQATHLEVLRSRTLPPDYVGQVTHNLWITGAQWCDFVSFDDRFPAPLRLCVIRVPRHPAAIESYELMARAFLTEVERDLHEIRQLATPVAA